MKSLKEYKSFLKNISIISIIFLVYISLSSTVSYADDSTINIPVSGTNNYSYSYDILNAVNKQRSHAGLSSLTMDETLLNDAMKRAAELAVFYSHTRPNGSKCFTIFSNDYIYAGENIGMGYTSPSAVATAWYDSPTHRENILNPNYTTIGIGCFKCNGVWYWVQLFTSNLYKKAKNSDSSKNVVVNVTTTKTHVSTLKAYSSKKTLNIAQTASAYVSFTVPYDDFSVNVNVDSRGITYSSSNKSVFTVNSNGIITAKGAGKAKLTMKLKSDSKRQASVTITVNKTKISSTSITGITTTSYTKKAIKQSIKIKKGSLTLKEGTDYTVSYKNNTKPGTASMIITGKNNYSGSVTKTFKIIVPQVTNVTKTSYSTTYINLKWSKQAVANGYIVQRYYPSTKSYKTIKTITSNTNYAKISGLATASSYKFRVKSYVTISDKRIYGNASSVLSAYTKPSCPSKFKVKKKSASSVKLTWSNVSRADGYVIYAIVSTGTSTKNVKLTIINNNSTSSYTDTSKYVSKTYSYSIRAFMNINGSKIYSSSKVIKI